LIALLAGGSVGCAPSVTVSGPLTGEKNNALIAVKDYETKGFVVIRSQERVDYGNVVSGSKITNEMLVAEAQRLGADAVINVGIDVRRKVSFDGGSKVTVFDYTATGLAIKYTEATLAAVGYQHFQGMASEMPKDNSRKSTLRWYHWLGGGVGIFLMMMIVDAAID
jgi:hypothetical protein